MHRTVLLSAAAAVAILAAGIAGAASTPGSASAWPGGPRGMMGRMGHMGPGMMGFGGPGRFGGGFMAADCRGEMPKPNTKPAPPKRADLEACLTKTFNAMDANHDGKVTFDELT